VSDPQRPRDALATRAVHAGLRPDPSFGSVIPAIHQTSTYAQRAPGEFVRDYDYARSANPREAVQVATRTRLFTLAESLGGVESLIEVPQAMTHQSVEGSAAAVSPDLVRLSCGVEAPEDLVTDLRQALAVA
jgi:cystathionine beta-lyase/cystathionine gamma-synthase